MPIASTHLPIWPICLQTALLLVAVAYDLCRPRHEKDYYYDVAAVVINVPVGLVAWGAHGHVEHNMTPHLALASHSPSLLWPMPYRPPCRPPCPRPAARLAARPAARPTHN